VLRELGVWADVAQLSYPIRGLRLGTPGGRSVRMDSPAGLETAVCLRRDLDHRILTHAVGAGARFVPRFRARSPLVEAGRWVGMRAFDGREIRARWVVVADGAHSKMALDARPKRAIHAIMGWWEGVPFEAGIVEMIFAEPALPYYGWLFPESKERVNIGVTYDDPTKSVNARALFRDFLDRWYAPRLRGATQIGAWKGHPIVYAYSLARLTALGRVVVGEAGRMTHPATGEGIYQGMWSGARAAEAIADAAAGRLPEQTAMARYEARCRTNLLPSFWVGGLFKALLRTPALDLLARAAEAGALNRAVRTLLATS
jgi:flavin-dependent dehydrogenase